MRKYYFNNINAYTSFGCIFEQGTFAELLSPPSAWPNEERKVSLSIAIVGNDEVDFWIKYNAFTSFIAQNVEFNLLVGDLHRRFRFTYDSISAFKMLTSIQLLGEVCCRFTLVLIDDYPDVKTFTRTASFTSEITGEVKVFQRIYSSFTLADATELSAEDDDFEQDGQRYANGLANIEIINPEPIGYWEDSGNWDDSGNWED